MANKENAKQKTKGLLEKYDKVVVEKKFSKYTEADTKAEFIEPLFEALGWDVRNRDEVTREETISKGRVDYGFRISGIPKFFLEAKALREDLDDPKFAEQAINYAWHKGCTWAVLTDFDQGVKIFNAEWKTTDPSQSRPITIPRQEFLDRFEKLWLLSKESFERGLLDEEAKNWGKKTKKNPVGEQLLNDLTTWRTKLSKDILERNKDKRLTEEELDEAVQRIIDRLIFIRNCEDRELEPPKLLSTIREWGSKRKGTLAECIIDVFSHFRDEYDSELFGDHLCDQLDVSNQVLEEIINGLDHTKDKTIKYDFSAIDADVLGNVYEQYLGHILKKTAKRATLTEKRVHRKEQGIYYTPTYVVDYILRNTLGELLKDKKVSVEKIRVLDPACGSGSFLIKAFDILNEFYGGTSKDYGQTQLDLEGGLPFTKKVRVLQNNIFGVDLDAQAVEIAQLNLLLKIAEKGHRLPLLQRNIKCGNSLIDDETVAGDKAFSWEERFKEIMEEGGFDVVVGNPPYIPIEMFPETDKDYYFAKYKSPYRKFDTSILFIERGISLLKEGGLLGFIVPLTWQTGDNYARFREFIFSKCNLKRVVNLPFDVFRDAYVDTGIVVLQKGKAESDKCLAYSYDKKERIQRIDGIKYHEIEQRFIDNEPVKKVFTNKSIYTLLEKLKENSVPLGDITDSCQGVVVSKFKISDSKVNDSYKKLLTAGSGNRYSLQIQETKYIDYSKAMNLYRYYSQPRIFARRIISRQDRLMASYFEEPLITKKDYNPFIVTDKKFNILYLLGLLNSKLFSYIYIYSSALALKDDFRQTTLSELRKLPIKIATDDEQKRIIQLVSKMLTLNKRLNEIGDKKTDERQRIEEEIKKTDAEIDEVVYKLYGITESEKEIIEESLK